MGKGHKDNFHARKKRGSTAFELKKRDEKKKISQDHG